MHRKNLFRRKIQGSYYLDQVKCTFVVRSRDFDIFMIFRILVDGFYQDASFGTLLFVITEKMTELYLGTGKFTLFGVR